MTKSSYVEQTQLLHETARPKVDKVLPAGMDVALCEQLMNTPVPTTFFKRTFFAVYFYFDLLILLTH